ncbi:MAG: hypothetical protein ACK5HP_04185 [Bacilli bacterium]
MENLKNENVDLNFISAALDSRFIKYILKKENLTENSFNDIGSLKLLTELIDKYKLENQIYELQYLIFKTSLQNKYGENINDKFIEKYCEVIKHQKYMKKKNKLGFYLKVIEKINIKKSMIKLINLIGEKVDNINFDIKNLDKKQVENIKLDGIFDLFNCIDGTQKYLEFKNNQINEHIENEKTR